MPSYGAHDAVDPDAWIVRGQAKAGTTHHYRCATAYGIVNHDRVTLAVVFMRATDTLPSVVERLLTIVRAAGYRIGCLYADKGFCRVAVIRYLQAEQVPAVIAALIQGGTRALYQGNKSSWTRYTFSSHKAGSVTVQLAVVRRFAKRRGKKRGVWCLFVSLGIGYDLRGIREDYLKRFGIESSSRITDAGTHLLTQCRAALSAHRGGTAAAEVLDRHPVALPAATRSGTASGGPRPAAAATVLRLARRCRHRHLRHGPRA